MCAGLEDGLLLDQADGLLVLSLLSPQFQLLLPKLFLLLLQLLRPFSILCLKRGQPGLVLINHALLLLTEAAGLVLEVFLLAFEPVENGLFPEFELVEPGLVLLLGVPEPKVILVFELLLNLLLESDF